MNKTEEFPQILIEKNGDPLEVVQLTHQTVPKPSKDEVLIQMFMAPVNPVDINIIQGVYGPVKMPLPSVPGYEGVGKVVEIGSDVTKFKVGDHVIPLRFLGSWRTYLVAPEDILFKIPNNLSLPEAATLCINPPTMYRILKDFVKLKHGDTVIQNGANSSCGVLAIQMCKILGLVSVNVVRNRPDIENLKSYLIKLGASYVYTEEEINNTDIFKTGKALRPMLAINCIGGKSASSVMRHLDIGGIMVTYGGMSMQPITVSTSALVFRDLSLVGFGIGKWMMDEDNKDEMSRMFNEIISWYLNKKMEVSPYVLVKLENYEDCLSNTLNKTGMIGKKYILDFSGISCKI